MLLYFCNLFLCTNKRWSIVCAPVRRDNTSFSEGIIDRTGAQTMLYLTCTTITNVDLAHYGVSRTKDWVSVNCGTNGNRIVHSVG